MAKSKNIYGDQHKKNRKKFHQRKGFILLLGIAIGIIFIGALYQTSVYFSTNESCMMCHVHPHAEESWKLSVHVNNGSGVMVNCVDCHLPPKDDTWAHYTAKAALGIQRRVGLPDQGQCGFRLGQKIRTRTCYKIYSKCFLRKMSSEFIPSGNNR